MAMGIIGGDWDGVDTFDRERLLQYAKDARAALPEFIVLDEDAKPEIGDLVEIIDHENIPDMCGYVVDIQNCNGIVYYIKPDRGCKSQDCRNSIQIRRRKGIPVFTRKKKK